MAGRTDPGDFDSLARLELSGPPPHATAGSTSTIANRSVINLANSSR
jgi:hypothetical protein